MKVKPIATPNELREHFLEQIRNGERLSFTSSDANKITIKAKQNEINKGTGRKFSKWIKESQ